MIKLSEIKLSDTNLSLTTNYSTASSIHFFLNNKTPLILKEDGFYYNGEYIDDAGQAHKLLLTTLGIMVVNNDET